MNIDKLNFKINLLMTARLVMTQLVSTKCVNDINELQIEEDENFDGSLFCEVWANNNVRVFVSQVRDTDIEIHQGGYNVMTIDGFTANVSPKMFEKDVDKLF